MPRHLAMLLAVALTAGRLICGAAEGEKNADEEPGKTLREVLKKADEYLRHLEKLKERLANEEHGERVEKLLEKLEERLGELQKQQENVEAHLSKLAEKLGKQLTELEKKLEQEAPRAARKLERLEEWEEFLPPGIRRFLPKPRLGVQVAEVTEELNQRYQNPAAKKGAYVLVVNEDSPAKKAGIQVGDLVVKFADKEVENVEDLTEMVGAAKRGNHQITIKRKGQEKELSVELAGGRLRYRWLPFGAGRWGEETFELSPELLEQLKLGEEKLKKVKKILQEAQEEFQERKGVLGGFRVEMHGPGEAPVVRLSDDEEMLEKIHKKTDEKLAGLLDEAQMKAYREAREGKLKELKKKRFVGFGRFHLRPGGADQGFNEEPEAPQPGKEPEEF